ncbi:MAG: ThuA domain-containing protein [Planctomycetota bacterium]|nr:MAG: ThuA domain-containing protein [Planctomycetota bacterium]
MFAKLGRYTPLIALLLIGQYGFAAEKIRVLLVDGQNNHNWRSTSPIIKNSLETTGKFTVDVTSNLAEKEKDKPGSINPTVAFPPSLENYDVVVSNYNGASWPDSFNTDLESRLKEGKIGLVIVHAANNAFGGWKEYNQMIGMGWRDKAFGKRVKVDDQGQSEVIAKGQGDSTGHRYTGVFTVVVRDPSHPVTKGMPKEWAHPRDELYDNLRGPAENLNILATSYSPGTKTHEPMIFTISYGKGRVFHTPLGHDAGAMGCAGFQATVERGTEWAATGKVSQELPKDFPADKVSLRK